MLDVDGIQVAYDSVLALRDVSVTVSEGEVVAVVGPNGAGKTTLLGAITGTRRITAGRVQFLGGEITGKNPEAIARGGISIVPEGRRIFATLTVRENLICGANLARSKGETPPSLDEMLELFPALGRYIDQHAATLSGGEQQQLAIARALLSRPRLLLLDEPSLGLSPKMVELVFHTIAMLKRDGLTILLVEQNVSEALEMADRAYVLRSGTVEIDGSADDIQGERIEETVLGFVRDEPRESL
jgi:branched-chain amino acid transport system ATP-binding protein